MKIFLILLFVGIASSSHNALKKASDEVLGRFIYGMSQAPALHEALGIPNTPEVTRFERSFKEDLANYLRELFDKALEKIKKAVDEGKEVHKEALEKLHDLREKMKDLKIEDDDFAEHTIEELKKQVTGKLKELLEKFGIIEKSYSNEPDDPLSKIFDDLNIRDFFIQLKKKLLEKMDAETLRKSIAKVVGQGAQRLCEWVTNKGKQKVIGFFDRVLDTDDDDRRKRSVSDLYEQIKEYFDELDMHLQKKFFRFGKWVKEVLEKGLDKSNNKIENVKTIAKQLLDKSKIVSKEVAKQALEYLKDYKEQLGELYDKVHERLMEKIMEYTD